MNRSMNSTKKTHKIDDISCFLYFMKRCTKFYNQFEWEEVFDIVKVARNELYEA